MYPSKIHLPKPMLRRLKAIAAKEEISIGEVVRTLIKEGMHERYKLGLLPLTSVGYDIDHDALQTAAALKNDDSINKDDCPF
jgi:hypothetical protein